MIGPLLGKTTITRRRVGAGTNNADGTWTAGTETDTSVVADPQPLNGQDLRVLPEGIRASDTLKVYSAPGTWRTEDPRLGQAADLAVIGGKVYRVVGVDERNSGILSHDKVYLTRLPEPNG